MIEYHVKTIPAHLLSTDFLNGYGVLQWDLVAVMPDGSHLTLVFKRAS